MLVLSRRVGQALHFTAGGVRFRIIVSSIHHGVNVRIAIDAPRGVEIMREELLSQEELTKGSDDADHS